MKSVCVCFILKKINEGGTTRNSAENFRTPDQVQYQKSDHQKDSEDSGNGIFFSA